MMIKVFTTDKNGKISFTPEELKKLLDEAYWEGYRNNNNSWTYTTPSWKPYTYTTTDNATTIKLSNNADYNNNTATTVSSSQHSCNTSAKGCNGKINCSENCR